MRAGRGTLEELKVADQKGRIMLGSRYAGKRFALREEEDGTTVLTPVVVIAENEGLLTSRRLVKRFAGLQKLTDDWDASGSLAPPSAVIDYAREVMAMLQASALARDIPWADPHVGANERGEVILEWWQENRTLTVFVRAQNHVEYLKAWGADIRHEMEDGEVSKISDFSALSHWLYEDAKANQ